MDLGLKGRNAVITGATRGIGRAIAETFASEGVNVAICARKANEVAEAVAALEKKGVKVVGGVVDIADEAGFKAWIAQAGDELGGIDMLVSNASALQNGNGEDAWKACFEIDVLGAVRATDAAMPYLLKAAERTGDASVVIISSVSAAETSYGNSYGAMKAAQIHLAKGLAKQFAGQHVRVNTISPGTVYFKGGVWDMIEQHLPDQFEAAMSRNPTGRMATPQDIANSAVFLSSARSSFTTGSNLVIDGAYSGRVNY